MEFTNISPGNPALKYIARRLLSKDYRGNHKSQHNRFDMDRVLTVLQLLDKYAAGGRMIIRNTDLKRRPQNTPEEATYARFCDEAKTVLGAGTQDSMRKNYFVDFEEMGLLHRFDKNGVLNDQTKATFRTRSVALSPMGREFLQAPTLVDRAFIYSRGIDSLLQGVIDVMIEVLGEEAVGKKIRIDEYMFILSAIGDSSDISLTKTEALELLRSYRALTVTQRQALDDMIKQYAKPGLFGGNKIQKRDYGNWKNECQQIFKLLGQTVYLEVQKPRGTQILTLKTEQAAISKEVATRLDRSLAEKHKYFEEHGVAKTPGFELHHVVALASSKNLQHFRLLDDARNMVYIDAFSHSLITQNNNRNVLMSFEGDTICLADYSGNTVKLEPTQNIRYDTSKKDVMQKYNDELNAYK